MKYVISKLESELKSLETTMDIKRKSKENFERQLNDSLVELYQLESSHKEILTVINMLRVQEDNDEGDT